MAFIRYKQRGQKWYVYQVENIWDKNLKKYFQRSNYLGVAQEKGGDYAKQEVRLVEKGVIDFGDSYMIAKTFEYLGLKELLELSVGNVDTIMNLVTYQLTVGSAMYNCKEWHAGNIAKYLFANAEYSSQKISKLFQQCGDDKSLMKFFQLYVKKFFQGKHGILIDSTALPSAINASINNWGYSASKIEHKVGCLMLIDEETKLPIFFRIIPGEIADISTLQFTINEINTLGLNIKSAIFDAGYFSEENIKFLCSNDINFVSRMPKSRTVFKELINSIESIEKVDNTIQYGKRVVFIETRKIRLYDHDMYAHIIFDLDKKSKDTNKLLSEYLANPSDKDDNLQIQYCGFLILISKTLIPKHDILPTYYIRQSIEQVFGFAKINNLLPLRVHSEDSIKGYVFVVFIALIIFITIRKFLKDYLTVEQAVLILRNWKCKIYDNKAVPMEVNKKVKEIFKKMNFTVPISVGI